MKKRLIDIIDFERINSLLEGFNKATGFVTAILDLEGNVLSKSGWRTICTDFHRISPETARRCTISDTVLAEKLVAGEKYHFYKCLNGLVDVAVPVIIDDEHVANLFSGQFFFKKPNLNFFKEQAEKYKFDNKTYLEALDKVPVVSEEKVKIAMDFLLDMTLLISEMTQQRTGQIELNKTLKESEERWQFAIEENGDGLFDWNVETNEIFYSKQWKGMLSFEDDEIENKFEEWDKLLHPDDKANAYLDAQNHLDSITNVYTNEHRLRCKDGSYKWILAKGKIISRTENNIPLRFIGTHRDITESKQVELELTIAKEKAQESTDLYFGLFNNSIIGLYQTTPSGEILSANNTIIKMLKFDSLEDLLQKDLTKGGYVDKNKRNEFKTILEEKGEITDFESEWHTKHGDIITVLEGAKAIKNAKGQIVRYDGAIQDITFKKRIQKELIISKERAEESDKLKSAFLANMSHEIRTPMNGILGFSELLKSPNLSGEKQQKYIEIIEKSGKRMLNIINDIVDISKIEAGLMNVEIKESNINEQIEYIYTFFKPEVEAKRMQLYFKNTLPAEEAIIKTDREKLFAILTNLVKNAIKYAKKGSIEFGYVLKMGAESVDKIQNNELEFFVKDTGIGIQKDRQEAIFERFIQADIKDTMARQGAGLGLSITKAYVEMLGGKIWVESEEGIGSTFYFTLPYNHELKEKINTKDIKVTDNTENRIKNLKILMAEDDETSGMLLSLHLSEFSNKILEARTGRETIEACRNNPDIDLILMDIKMPDLDGYEAMRQIRQFNKDVIIIAQTAYGLSGDREKCLDAGFNDYISKPIKKDHLGALIQKYFNK